eukprot:6212739-Pleurochrysis_carterae.AAC.4
MPSRPFGTQLTFETSWKRGCELPPFVVDIMSPQSTSSRPCVRGCGYSARVQSYSVYSQQVESANSRAQCATSDERQHSRGLNCCTHEEGERIGWALVAREPY